MQKKEKTWIEIELVDEGGKPYSRERYCVRLPDGTRREGQLNAQGKARIEDIDPGSCVVSFPDLADIEGKVA